MKSKIVFLSCLFLWNFSLRARQNMLQDVKLTDLTPRGWLRLMLENQKDNFTGKLDRTCFPFTRGGWGSEPFMREKNGIVSGFWVPYEQTAYYYDGMLRCGLLLRDPELTGKARKAVYGSIEKASEAGVIVPEISQGEMKRWPHAVFFRAMTAEYEATQNPDLLAGLGKHFRNDTVTYRGRDLCNIEILAWLYRTTGDKYYYEKIMRFKDLLGNSTDPTEEIVGKFAGSARQEVHAVTFHELLKLPVFFYELTGDKKYLDRVRRGFAKLDKYHMLPDGIASGEEGLSGNGSRNTHEMCNVVDYLWTCSYMLKATGETEWADRIEKALFNAGLGGITKNFDAHQYYSCPNQIVCADHSSTVSAYEDSRLAYRQLHRPPCCTGNLNRMFPVYVGSQWMKDDKKALYKMLFGPGEIKHTADRSEVTLREESSYPFGDTVRICVVAGEARFPLHIRIPGWCESPLLRVNGENYKSVKSGTLVTLERTFKEGDIVELVFPKRPVFRRWDHEAMVVNYGPLLLALPVKGDIRQVNIYNPKLQEKTYKGYRMGSPSGWNYILGVSAGKDTNFKIIETPVGPDTNPWAVSPSPLRVRVPAYKDPAWKPEYRKTVSPSGDEVFVAVTPALPARGAMIYALNNLKPEAVELVPYGSTLLRISMFPFWKQKEIPAEVLATENK